MQLKPEESRRLLDKVLEGLPFEDRSFFDSLSDQEAALVIQMLQEEVDTGKSPTFDIIWEQDWEYQPVSIEQFIEDKQYMGDYCQQLYDAWKQEICFVLSPKSTITEWVCTGAIGIGKTTATLIAHLYKIYRLLGLREPATYYDLNMNESIMIGLLNISLTLARRTNYNKLIGMMETSPFFMQFSRVNNHGNRYFDWSHKKIEFMMGSGSEHVLSTNIIGATLEETDFSKTKGTKDRAAVYKAQSTYTAIQRRMESRFGTHLKDSAPGILTMVSSSVQDDESFLNKRIESAEKYPDQVYVSQFSVYEIKSHLDIHKGPRFPVFLGDERRLPNIISKGEVNVVGPTGQAVYDSDRIEWVPEHYRKQFEEDIETAILDICGKRIGSKRSRYLHRMDLLYKCTEKHSVGSPFTKETLEVTIDNAVEIKDFFLFDKMFERTEDVYTPIRPKVNQGIPRFIHVDLAKNGDAAGIGCVHPFGYTESKIKGEDGRDRVIKSPHIYVDFYVRLVSTKQSEIDFEEIRKFIHFLLSCGLEIESISFDSYQSVDSLQYFKKMDAIRYVENVSVDKKGTEYGYLRSFIIQNRLIIYESEVCFREFKYLEQDPFTKKVDHPQKGSKDITDSICGATSQCVKYWNSIATMVLPLADSLAKYQQVSTQYSRSLGLEQETQKLVKVLKGKGSILKGPGFKL